MTERRILVGDPAPRVVREALRLVSSDRQARYGSPRDNIERIRVRWSQVCGVELTLSQVCLMMADLKIARLVNDPEHEDSWIDLVGYAVVRDLAQQL